MRAEEIKSPSWSRGWYAVMLAQIREKLFCATDLLHLSSGQILRRFNMNIKATYAILMAGISVSAMTASIVPVLSIATKKLNVIIKKGIENVIMIIHKRGI
jgi:hypothetical protein